MFYNDWPGDILGGGYDEDIFKRIEATGFIWAASARMLLLTTPSTRRYCPHLSRFEFRNVSKPRAIEDIEVALEDEAARKWCGFARTISRLYQPGLPRGLPDLQNTSKICHTYLILKFFREHIQYYN
jgi:hypothetical protein